MCATPKIVYLIGVNTIKHALHSKSENAATHSPGVTAADILEIPFFWLFARSGAQSLKLDVHLIWKRAKPAHFNLVNH